MIPDKPDIETCKQAVAAGLAAGKRLLWHTPQKTAYLSARIQNGQLRLSAASLPGCTADALAAHTLETWLKELGIEGDVEQRSQSYRSMLPLDNVEALLENCPWDNLLKGSAVWPLESKAGSPILFAITGGSIDE